MIAVSELSVRVGSFTLEDVNLKVNGGECLTLIGPNGSGKTTCLECIAGLRRASRGRIVIDDVDVTNMPPEKRGVGYVPQDYVLFSHLNVRENVVFGLRNVKERGDSAWQVMRWLQIDHLAERRVTDLSGGERQKVALARALAVNPRVLLLDEPLAALDPLSRERLRMELKNIISKILDAFNIPLIYVTHDLSEAELISDHVAVMNRGRIEQTGSRIEVFDRPRTRFVAEFLGYNTFNGQVVESKNGLIIVDVKGTLVQAVAEDVRVGEDVSLALRPQSVAISHKGEASVNWQKCRCNVIKGTVIDIYRVGPSAKILIDIGVQVAAYVDYSMLDELDVGSTVFAHFKADSVRLLRECSTSRTTTL